MIRKSIATIVLIGLIMSAVIIGMKGQASDTAGVLKVATSYYPLYDFAKQVGGDKVLVSTITPAGAEPHDYEPSAKLLAESQKASVFVYNGLRFEPWTDAFLKNYKHIAVAASKNTKAASDPHFWLDPILAKTIIDNIRDGLSRADPKNSPYYSARAKAYSDKLTDLDNTYHSGLAECRVRTIISSHDAFGYIARRYNITVDSIAGLSPDQEPSAARLAELTRIVREKQITYVFFESLVSSRLADTIATETGASTLVLDPIEGVSDEDQKQGKDYLGIQYQNIQNLRRALACR